MKKIWLKIRKLWLFTMRNPVVRAGKTEAFQWKFRRFDMEVRTFSGNWIAKWTAAEFPYGYLVSGKDDTNIIGFCQTMYEVGMLLTTDQRFVNDIQKALQKYSQRIEKSAKVVEDETEEKIALEFEKQVQEHIEKRK